MPSKRLEPCFQQEVLFSSLHIFFLFPISKVVGNTKITTPCIPVFHYCTAEVPSSLI